MQGLTNFIVSRSILFLYKQRPHLDFHVQPQCGIYSLYIIIQFVIFLLKTNSCAHSKWYRFNRTHSLRKSFRLPSMVNLQFIIHFFTDGNLNRIKVGLQKMYFLAVFVDCIT